MQVHERRAVNLISCVLLNRRFHERVPCTPAWRMYGPHVHFVHLCSLLVAAASWAAWLNIQPPSCTTLPTPQMLGQGARAKR